MELRNVQWIPAFGRRHDETVVSWRLRNLASDDTRASPSIFRGACRDMDVRHRVALQIFDCSGFLCGKIVWLLRPDDPAGQPALDHRNPDPALRQRHLCGLTIVWGLRPAGQNHWSNGWLYDPKDGITYHVSARLTSATIITARVYRGTPLVGRTEILVRDPHLRPDGRC